MHLTANASGANSGTENAPMQPKKGGTGLGVACDDCRRRKAGCDGQRPMCGPCTSRKLVCRWETRAGETRAVARSRRTLNLTQENEALREENEALRRRLEPDGHPLSDGLPSSRSVRPTSSLLPTPSFQLAAQATLPSSLTAIEYELLLAHAHAYAFRDLPDLATLKSLHSKRIRRVLGEVPFAAQEASTPDLLAIDGASLHTNGVQETNQDSHQPPHNELSWARLPSGPFPTYQDERLDRIDVTAWCSVAVLAEIVGPLIAFYLEMDHPVMGHFDADLFVDDLVAGRTDYCSSLLLHSLLLWACHGYSTFDQRAILIKPALYAEALRLWYQEQNQDSILTAASGIFLHMACLCQGDEKAAQEVLLDLYAMAHRLDLYGPACDALSMLDEATSKPLRARAHTAWGLFNMITRCVFVALARVYGTTFPKFCKLWLILNEVALVYCAVSWGSITERTSLDFAEEMYGRLLNWADANGPLISDWASDTHHQTYLHIVFHTAIIDIFRPFLGTNIPLKAFRWRNYTANHVFVASVNQLYNQLLMYPTLHPSSTFIFWCIGVVQCAKAAMTNLQNPDSQQNFLLCLIALYDLSPCFPNMSTVLSGFLSIATRMGYLRIKSARQLYERLQKNDRRSREGNETLVGSTLDLSPASRGLAAATASGQLAKTFEEVMLMDIPACIQGGLGL